MSLIRTVSYIATDTDQNNSQTYANVSTHKAATLTVAGKCGQPKTEGVQVVEGVGLVASGFKFLLGLAAVFAVAWVHVLCPSQETQLDVIGRQFRGVNCSSVGRP